MKFEICVNKLYGCRISPPIKKIIEKQNPWNNLNHFPCKTYITRKIASGALIAIIKDNKTIEIIDLLWKFAKINKANSTQRKISGFPRKNTNKTGYEKNTNYATVKFWKILNTKINRNKVKAAKYKAIGVLGTSTNLAAKREGNISFKVR